MILQIGKNRLIKAGGLHGLLLGNQHMFFVQTADNLIKHGFCIELVSGALLFVFFNQREDAAADTVSACRLAGNTCGKQKGSLYKGLQIKSLAIIFPGESQGVQREYISVIKGLGILGFKLVNQSAVNKADIPRQ